MWHRGPTHQTNCHWGECGACRLAARHHAPGTGQQCFWGQVDRLVARQAVVETANVLITASSATPTPTAQSATTATPSPSNAATPPSTNSPPAGQAYFRGLNLFGGWQSAYGGTDQFPTATQLDYYKAKGLNWFRVPLLWEHLQPALNAPLDAQYLAMMDALVSGATGHHGYSRGRCRDADHRRAARRAAVAL